MDHSSPRRVTIRRVHRGYVVVDDDPLAAVSTKKRERVAETIEGAVELAVLSLGDGSTSGYPIGTKVEVRIHKPLAEENNK